MLSLLIGIFLIGWIAASIIGTQTVDAPDASSFTAFETLTEETVISWIEAKFEEDRIANMQASLDAQIQEQIAPTKLTLTLGQTEELPQA